MAGLGKNIEENLVEPIVSILPPKTLMRFKCVSKQWYALINSPRFVAKHLSNSISMHDTSTRVLLKLSNTNSNDPADQTTEEVSYSLLKFCNVDNDNDEHSFLASCEDVTMSLLNMTRTGPDESLCVIGHCNGITCLAMANSCEVLLWNPAIEEFKLLPTLPYLPDSDPPEFWSPQEPWWRFKDALGFGYCPKSNDYQIVNIGFFEYEEEPSDNIYIYRPPTAAVYTLGTDSWREAKSCSLDLETETTLLWPENFQMYFKGICYWIGREQHKEEDVYDAMEERFIRGIIVLFHLDDEVFHAMLLPDSIFDWRDHCMADRLLEWNESIALFGTQESYGNYIFGIWVMDEFGVHNGAWTKQFSFDEFTAKPLTFLKSDEILMADDANECLFSYNLGTKNLKYLPIQRVSNYSATVVCVDSIVSLSRGNKLETGDNSTNADFSLCKCSPFSYSMADKKWHSYSVWAFPPDDVCLRIKKVMDGLRAEFAGPKIEPHIPVVGSIRMTHDEALSKFRSLQSSVIYSYKAKVNKVVTRNFYYQCVSLLIDSSYEDSFELFFAAREYGAKYGFYTVHRPRLSLLCGNLTGEERTLAQEKVSIMDESIASLSFPITRLALYKINYRDTTLKSWEKIEEYSLLFK